MTENIRFLYAMFITLASADTKRMAAPTVNELAPLQPSSSQRQASLSPAEFLSMIAPKTGS